jgi:hypothetical protein
MSDGRECTVYYKNTSLLLNYDTGFLLAKRTLFFVESTMDHDYNGIIYQTVFPVLSGF